MKFSLIIPCYNEAKNLPLLLEKCRPLTHEPEIEVVLVDNGSTDESAIVLDELLLDYPNCRSVRVEVNQGYGFGILTGLKAAKGEILGWTHADLQTDPRDALQGLKLFEEKGDRIFVKGKRFGRPLSDQLFTIGMSVFETLLLKCSLWDINAQPTMFTRHFFATWEAAPSDFSLDLYAYYTAKQAGLAVHRFPVKFGERAHGSSHWNVDWAAKQKFIKRTVDYSLELRKNVAR